MNDTTPDKKKDTHTTKAQRDATRAAAAREAQPSTPANDRSTSARNGIAMSGAAAAAGVLTAVDEDVDGGEEAPLPVEFEYYSDEEEKEEAE